MKGTGAQKRERMPNIERPHSVPRALRRRGVKMGKAAAVRDRATTTAAIALAQSTVYVSMRYALIEICKMATSCVKLPDISQLGQLTMSSAIPRPNGTPPRIGMIQ